MQILIALMVATVAAMQTLSVNNRIVRSESVLVKRVIDGDTIDVAGVGRVRLLGVRRAGDGTWIRHAGAVRS